MSCSNGANLCTPSITMRRRLRWRWVPTITVRAARTG